MHTTEKKKVIKAIGDLGRRVTPADVATKTGLPVLVVQQELNKVASETNGHLQVGNTGDIVYSFTPGFSSAYLARGMQAAFLLVGAKILEVLYYILRISFGVALIVSLVIVVVLLIAIAIAMMMRGGGDRDDRDGGLFGGFGDFGSGGFHFSFWDWMILRDLLWWNSSPRYQTVRYDYSRPTVRARPRSNFLLNCFSFLFGDGNPNEGLEEKRWQVIAQVIKRHNNVVTAEQLAPYTGADPKDEDAVLPTLVRFNGRPEVTESGNIVYVFESLQSIAAEQSVDPPPYLQEFPWKFSTVPDGELLPVYIVAGLNMAGAYVVWNFFQHLKFGRLDEATAAVAAQGASGLLVLVNFLLVYAIAFVTVPIIRAGINAVRNKGIDARNVLRFRYAQMAQHPSPELSAKLVEAQQYKLRDRKLAQKDMVFTTEEDSREQADDLTEQFDELAKSQKPSKAEKAVQQPDPGFVIDASPNAEDDPDDVRIINIKKHAEEFDASP